MATLRAALPTLGGAGAACLVVEKADEFSYRDPVDASVSERQGVRIRFTDGSRVVMRLSGTGTEGATLRVYLERYVASDGVHDEELQAALAPVAAAADAIAGVAQHTGRTRPDVAT